MLEWLTLLHLEEYFNILCQQGYDTIDRVTELAWEDLEEVGIKKLGNNYHSFRTICSCIFFIYFCRSSKENDVGY